VTLSAPSALPQLRRFAFWLDAGIAVPGTSIRVGLDPLLGLVPGLGDAAGALLAAWILVEAIRMGASRGTLARIASNIALDALVGAIPVFGDVFDVVWKANLKNVALLERHAIDPAGAGKSDRLFVALLVGGVAVLSVGLLVGGVVLAAWLLRARFGH
jgi:uncharacterized protein DUF4112